jgi:hypothetical protein
VRLLGARVGCQPHLHQLLHTQELAGNGVARARVRLQVDSHAFQ